MKNLILFTIFFFACNPGVLSNQEPIQDEIEKPTTTTTQSTTTTSTTIATTYGVITSYGDCFFSSYIGGKLPLQGSVYFTEFSHQADLNIYLTQYSHQALINVYFTEFSHQTTGVEDGTL